MATNRDKIIKIRVRKDEYKLIWQRALDKNQSISEYMRTIAFEDIWRDTVK